MKGGTTSVCLSDKLIFVIQSLLWEIPDYMKKQHVAVLNDKLS